MRFAAIVGVLAISGPGLVGTASPQSGTSERKEKTKIEIKGGKEVTLTGCLERSSGNTDYVLTDDVGRLKYAVVTDDNLAKYVDQRVRVKGHASDQGDAKVKTERKVEGTAGQTAESRVETRGDSTLIPYLGLQSIKTIDSSCR
ncbi:MAG TPA: hypothetical protein VKE96_24315 [Vicinamibacterales bacterium]|nr:hypothetical protein [Vicinamibacterales bacterium]